MENGLILALFASVSFAICAVVVRKATAQTGESFTPAAISVFFGIPFFAVALFFAGEWNQIASVSWRAFVLLGMAGIIHFVIGRRLSYNAYRLIGANKATPFIMTSPFYSAIFGVLFLKESLTVTLVLGLLLIFAGAALITIERKSISEGREKVLRGDEVKGIILALGGALCWGTSPILVRAIVGEVGSPFVRAFISYAAAAIVAAGFFLRRRHREQMVQIPLAALVPLIIGGIFTSTGQMFSYTALGYSPASMIAPLMSTQVLFILLLSFLINRQIEVFTPKVILGMVATVAGTFFIFQ